MLAGKQMRKYMYDLKVTKKKKDYNNLIVKKPIRLNKTYNILLFPQKTNYV